MFRTLYPAVVTLRVEPRHLSLAGQVRLRELLDQYSAEDWVTEAGHVHCWGIHLNGVVNEAVPGIVLDLQAVAHEYSQDGHPPRLPSPADSFRRWLKTAR